MRATLVILALVTASPAAAQVRRPAVFESSALAQTRTVALPTIGDTANASIGLLYLGGIAGGAIGLFGGVFVGMAMEQAANECEGELLCGVSGGAWGAIVGETFMLPLGVHLVNGSRGPIIAQMLASSAVTGAAFLTAYLAPNLDDYWVFAVPVAQLIAVVTLERRATLAPR